MHCQTSVGSRFECMDQQCLKSMRCAVTERKYVVELELGWGCHITQRITQVLQIEHGYRHGSQLHVRVGQKMKLLLRVSPEHATLPELGTTVPPDRASLH